MTAIDGKTDIFSSQGRSDLSSTHSPFSMDCSPFLNWSEEEEQETVDEQIVVYRSLVATVKFQPALDDSLEAKAVKFLESVECDEEESADAFLSSFGRTPDDSLTNFVQSIAVLLCYAKQTITTATIGMLDTLIEWCSAKIKLAFVKADLIPQLTITLKPQCISLTEGADIHINLMKIIN
ncbi:hypothetical protein BLNAU_4774 [Blattamonas nauphoetae]|uniref:Uncharacterized protein n=1 Tax=Blattamonas nauphoetae TaxID=2049346 RepID=A0ABQ9Y8X4_9EUKA|nr:hypothetical protein BLNAU_4774 [Blattamonas nauphoetae]